MAGRRLPLRAGRSLEGGFALRAGRSLEGGFALRAFADGRAIALPLVRARGRARQDCGAPGRWPGDCFAIGCAKPFCRARPVRAPMAGKCLRAWQSAPQGRAPQWPANACAPGKALRKDARPKGRQVACASARCFASVISLKKNSATPLRAARRFAILAPSADGPGSRKERDDLVFLGG